MSIQRRHFVALSLVVTAVLGSSPVALAQTQSQAREGPYRFALVQNDLEEAMKNEAFDAEKYAFYAKQARERGNQDLAAVFERVADLERGEHYKALAALSAREVAIDPAEQQAKLAKLANQSDSANLRDAMTTERFQANTLRSDMVNRAIKYGDIEAAQVFLNLGQAEIRNLLELRAAKKLVRSSQSQSPSAQT